MILYGVDRLQPNSELPPPFLCIWCILICVSFVLIYPCVPSCILELFSFRSLVKICVVLLVMGFRCLYWAVVDYRMSASIGLAYFRV